MTKILVVDDEESVLDLLEGFLVEIGHDVLTASSGQEALAKLDQRPAIVLLDYLMPGVSGMEVLDRIKWISASTEVIMLTASAEHEVGMETFKRGARDFVTKPINLANLRFLLDNLTDLHHILGLR